MWACDPLIICVGSKSMCDYIRLWFCLHVIIRSQNQVIGCLIQVRFRLDCQIKRIFCSSCSTDRCQDLLLAMFCLWLTPLGIFTANGCKNSFEKAKYPRWTLLCWILHRFYKNNTNIVFQDDNFMWFRGVVACLFIFLGW